MIPEPPPGQGPIDPRGAFSPPPPPDAVPQPPPGSPTPPPGAPQPAPAAGPTPPSAPRPAPGSPQTYPPPAGGPFGPLAPQPTAYPPMRPMMPMGPMGPMPPMGFAGPMMPMMPGFQPKPRGVGRTIFTILLVLLLVGSLLVNLVLMLVGLGGSGGSQQAAVIAGEPTQKIAVIPVAGVIMEPTAERFAKMLRQAELDVNVKAIVIEIDTPGGAVTPSDEINHKIQQFRTDHPGKPVVVSMGGLATSGGYYIACAGQYVFARPNTLTGNIGVLLPRYNVSKLAEKWGFSETTITAPKVGYKNAGSMFAEIKPEEDAYLQGLIDEAFVQFKDRVNKGRMGKLTKKIDDIANGKVYTASEAKKLGLIDDDQGYSDKVFGYTATLAGLSKPTVVRYHEAPSLMDLLGAEGKSSAGTKAQGGTTVNINGVNVDAGAINELLTPRLLYQWKP